MIDEINARQILDETISALKGLEGEARRNRAKEACDLLNGEVGRVLEPCDIKDYTKKLEPYLK